MYIGASSPAFFHQGSTDSKRGVMGQCPPAAPRASGSRVGPSLAPLTPSLALLVLALSVPREPGRGAACTCQPSEPGSGVIDTILA